MLCYSGVTTVHGILVAVHNRFSGRAAGRIEGSVFL